MKTDCIPDGNEPPPPKNEERRVLFGNILLQAILFILLISGLIHRQWGVTPTILFIWWVNYRSGWGVFWWYSEALNNLSRPDGIQLSRYLVLAYLLESTLYIVGVGLLAGVVGGVWDNYLYRDWFSIVNWVVLGGLGAILSFIALFVVLKNASRPKRY